MSKHQFMKLTLSINRLGKRDRACSRNGVILRNDSLLKILYQFIKNAVKMSVNKAIVNTLV